MVSGAAQSGNIEMLEYCYQRDESLFDKSIPKISLRNKDKDQALEVLKWLRQTNCPWDNWTCSSAAENDNLKALEWARSGGCAWDTHTFGAAARNGNIEMLAYCLENGCPMDTWACQMAMRNKNDSKAIETLKWLRRHSLPWDKYSCYGALESKNFSCLMFALENGCPYTKELFQRVMESDAIHAFEFYLKLLSLDHLMTFLSKKYLDHHH